MWNHRKTRASRHESRLSLYYHRTFSNTLPENSIPSGLTPPPDPRPPTPSRAHLSAETASGEWRETARHPTRCPRWGGRKSAQTIWTREQEARVKVARQLNAGSGCNASHLRGNPCCVDSHSKKASQPYLSGTPHMHHTQHG